MISSLVIRHSLPDRATSVWDQRLRRYMKIKGGIPYSTELADNDLRSLYESGYVDDVRFLAEPDEQAIRFIVEVQDRPPFGPSAFIGNTAFSDQKLAKVITPSIEGYITESQVEAARQELEQYYRGWGYKQVHITIDYEHWGKRSVQDFVFVIEEGPRTPPWYERFLRPVEKATAP